MRLLRRALNAGVLLCGVLGVLGEWPFGAQSRALELTHVNVVDVVSGAVLRDVTVTIVDAHITGVEPTATRRRSGAQVLDGAGKYVIPGLWDMHVHWYEARLLTLFIANGVTGIRQMFGGPNLLRWRRQIESGTLVGPRHVVASPILDGPQPVWPGSIVVADAAGGRDAVRRIAREGYDFVKVYNRLPREAYFAILGEAAQHHLSVVGHVPAAVTVDEAADAGQKTIEHLSGILRALNPYDDAKASALLARFRAKDTWQCPTLTVLRANAWLDRPDFRNDSRLKYIPSAIRENWKPETNPVRRNKTSADYERDRHTWPLQLHIVSEMQRAGVNILAGTDTSNPYVFPGFSLHDELGLLVDAGLTPLQALQAATLNPARFLGRRDRQGTVERGRMADLVVLDANPLADISATKRIAAVILGGRLYDRAALDAMLADAERVVTQ